MISPEYLPQLVESGRKTTTGERSNNWGITPRETERVGMFYKIMNPPRTKRLLVADVGINTFSLREIYKNSSWNEWMMLLAEVGGLF